MKIVVASAGLANMMFAYALVIAFRKRGVKSLLFVTESNAAHHGYELQSVFHNVKPYEGIGHLFAIYYKVLGKLRNMHIRSYRVPNKVLLFPFKEHYLQECMIYYPEVFGCEKNVYYERQCQSYKYYEGCYRELCNAFAFDDTMLSSKSNVIRDKIRDCNSVSIHIRRGDYLYGTNRGLGNVCNESYYKKTIEFLKTQTDNPVFFVFSDDKEWVKKHFNSPNMIVVDHNYGKDSWQDMYLMSKCCHNICANSSFSWWAAYLNQNREKIVVVPKKWYMTLEYDEVPPPEWIRL